MLEFTDISKNPVKCTGHELGRFLFKTNRDETYIIGLPVDREILVHVQVKTF